MNGKKPEIIYSDPVKEIMGNPPGRILRYGTAIIFSVFVLFILFAWLIKYPDTIPSPVEITTVNPPVTLTSKITGNIKVLSVKDKDTVSAGQILAVMETAASVDEIRVMKQFVDTISDPELLFSGALPVFPGLGELQEPYQTFVKNITDLKNYTEIDYYGKKIASLSSEISSIKEYIGQLVVKERLYSDNQHLESRKYRRDSLLFAGKVIPESELEQSRQSLIRTNIELQQVKLDHSGKSIELAEKQQVLEDYNIKRIEEKKNLQTVITESFSNLKGRIRLWENNYLLVSPVAGIVSFTRYWSVNQTVTKDELVMTVIPRETGSYIGRISLVMQRSGKVRVGQLVNIKLSGFPYLEYGMIRGIVRSKSLVPAKDAYIIEIDLPQGLTTLYGARLEFTQNMQGTAEIITEDIRLIQKIMNPLRYMVTRNRR